MCSIGPIFIKTDCISKYFGAMLNIRFEVLASRESDDLKIRNLFKLNNGWVHTYNPEKIIFHL